MTVLYEYDFRAAAAATRGSVFFQYFEQENLTLRYEQERVDSVVTKGSTIHCSAFKTREEPEHVTSEDSRRGVYDSFRKSRETVVVGTNKTLN